MKPASFLDPAAQAYQQARIAHWDAMARKRDSWQGMGGWYHRRLQEIYRFQKEHTDNQGNVHGSYRASGIRPTFLADLKHMGIDIPPSHFDPSRPL